jgi:nucleotide-binding universal stress UspA family protein
MHVSTSRFLRTKIESGANKAGVILEEAEKGYDLIVMGASERQGAHGALFSQFVDRVVQDAPCATMVVQSNDADLAGTGGYPIQQILVPTSGTVYSQQALEVASVIAAQTQAVVILVNVVNRTIRQYSLFEEQNIDAMTSIAHQIVQQQAAIAEGFGAMVKSVVLHGIPEFEILRFARTQKIDLIVLGSGLQTVTGRVFFGHRVDAILNQAPCPVAVVTIPTNPQQRD